MSRPEHFAPPEIFYNEEEARRYTSSSRMIEIQTKMSKRSVELLNLPSVKNGGKPLLLLDLGCGSGLSGGILERNGHLWVGLDISSSMLEVALEREVKGDLFQADLGQGLFFRPGAFDGAISISALQWLCNADKKSHEPRRRLSRFFQSLFQCLSRGARAVFQFYPECPAQMELITSAALRSGFTGGLVVDFPHSTKAKKYFLCLFAGPSTNAQLPPARGVSDFYDEKDAREDTDSDDSDEDNSEQEDEKNDEDSDGMNEEDSMEVTSTSKLPTVPETEMFSAFRSRDSAKRTREKNNNRPRKRAKMRVKSREWILHKKESQRRKGLNVRPDTKYTARKRSGPRGF